jgi:phosphate transport system substrate-binding protein
MAVVLAAGALALSACHDQAGGMGARDQIRIVGSSTVFPFTTMVAERFVASHPGARPPVVESTGTGGGFRLFCGGVGADYPDIADASRRMRRSEYRSCRQHGVDGVIELQVGIDGIAFAQSRRAVPLALRVVDLYRALAAAPTGRPNTARTWADVNPSLPAVPIQVYGPPATSGTRDALAELILARGCEASRPDAALLRERAPDRFARVCETIRSDGAYVDAGENDNVIVQKLGINPDAVGIFGYSYLEANAGQVRGIALDGVPPTYADIAAARYPGARPLFLYVKRAHLNAVHGLREFLASYVAMWAADGPLVKRGLIAAPADVLARSASALAERRALDPAVLAP